MTFLTFSLTCLGGILLTHSIYSSYEHSFLAPASTSTGASAPKLIASYHPLPADITIETLVSTFLLTIAIICSAPALRPIRWKEWAGKIEREGWDPHAESNIGKVVEGVSSVGDGSGKGKGGIGNPYRVLEERRAFWNVRESRKVFADFIRNGAKA